MPQSFTNFVSNKYLQLNQNLFTCDPKTRKSTPVDFTLRGSLGKNTDTVMITSGHLILSNSSCGFIPEAFSSCIKNRKYYPVAHKKNTVKR